MILSELKPGQSAVIRTVGGEGALRQHFLDMGLIPGVEVTMIKLAPMGDPMELRLHSYELTLRLADAEKIRFLLIIPVLGKVESIIQRQERTLFRKERPSLLPWQEIRTVGKRHSLTRLQDPTSM